MLQSLQYITVKPDRNLVVLFFGLFRNDYCHDVYSLLMNSFSTRIAFGFGIKLEGQVRERLTSENQRARKGSWRIIATIPGSLPHLPRPCCDGRAATR
jgi:hypothetical protein